VAAFEHDIVLLRRGSDGPEHLKNERDNQLAHGCSDVIDQLAVLACSRNFTFERGQAGCEFLQSALRIARLGDTQRGGLKVRACFATAFRVRAIPAPI